jgi:hypothetical protein
MHPSQPMTGSELQALLREKWGCSYDVQLRRMGGRVVLLVMWRYLEQPSFPLTEAEYLARLESVMAHLQAWGVWETVRREIEATRQKPRIGKAGGRAGLRVAAVARIFLAGQFAIAATEKIHRLGAIQLPPGRPAGPAKTGGRCDRRSRSAAEPRSALGGARYLKAERGPAAAPSVPP